MRGDYEGVRMAGWEIAVLVGGAVAGLVLGLVFRRRLYAVVLRMVADSLLRVFGLLIAIFVVSVIVMIILVESLQGWYQAAPTVTVLAMAIYVIGVSFGIGPFMPNSVPASAGSASEDIRKAGGRDGVSLALGWGGGILAVIVLCADLVVPLLVLVDV